MEESPSDAGAESPGARPLRIALDLSCAFERPLTGVAYAAMYQMRALAAQREDLDLRLIATRARAVPAELPGLERAFSRSWVKPNLRRLKILAWRRLAWPPVEWFVGEADIVHGLFHQLPAAKEAKRAVTVHDLSFYAVPETHTAATIRHHRRFLSQSARDADAIIAISESCRRELMEILGVERERIHLVRQGVEPSEFEGPLDADRLEAHKRRLGIQGGYFIHLGTVEPRKNIPRLIAAYRELRKRRPDAPQLVLVGARGWLTGPSMAAIRAAAGAGVVYAGYQPRAAVVLLLKGALASVYPSLYEGFGLPALEALAAGTPVVAADRGALPEVVGEDGLLVDAASIASITAGLERVLDDPGGARLRAERGLERARAQSWQKSAAELKRVYARIAAGEPAC